MKGLMVTLLVVFGSGTSLAQQFGGNEFSADRTNQSANQSSSRLTPQTRLQPLTRSIDRTSMRVAQSSSTGNSGFNPTSSQTIGGTDYKDGDSSPSTAVPIDTPDKDGLYGGQPMRGGRGGQQQSAIGRQNNPPSGGGQSFPSNQSFPARSNTTSGRSSSVGQSFTPQQSNNQLRAWPLPVSPEWERTLKAEGYIYAPIKQHEQNSIGEVVMFQDGTKFGNRSGAGSNVTRDQWEVYKDTAIIDVDDFSLQEIQKGTLTLRDLGATNLTGVALRYVGENGNKIDVRRIGNIPGNAAAVQVSSRNDFGQNQPIANRGTRPNERQFNTSGQRDVSFSDRNLAQDDRRNFDSPARDSVGNGGWNLNDDQQIRQPRQPRQFRQGFQRDDRSVSRRDLRDQFGNDNRDRFGNDNRDRLGVESRDFSRTSDRRLSNDYFDSLQGRDFYDRDQRDADYVRNSINQNRGDDYLLRSDFGTGHQQRDTYQDDRYLRSNRVSDNRRDGRSTDYDANFAKEKRELEERYLAAKRLEVKDAEEAAWRKHQRESMDQARLDRMYEDELTTPFLGRRSNVSNNYRSGPYRFGADRLADRSTDPIYRGQRADALSPATVSNASADRVAQILAEKEADLDAKIGAIDHLMKLDSASRNLDSKINSLKNVNPQTNSSQGRVKSLVPNTLGGDLAAPRHARLASANRTHTQYDGLNGGAPPMNINGFGQHGQRNRGGSSYGNEPTTGAGDSRMLRLMWLLLLISLGANVYLAMLSRSFYTQYEELADELRETFSTSSSISSPRHSSISSSRHSSRHTQRDSLRESSQHSQREPSRHSQREAQRESRRDSKRHSQRTSPEAS